MDEPLAVALKFGFLAVLYLFLLWVARSELKDMRRREAVDPLPDPVQPRARRREPAAAERSSARPRLEVVAAKGLEPGEAFDVAGGATLGRSDGADVPVDDPFASSSHARIFARGEAMYIEDLGSTNGTYLNGRQLQSAERLKRSDVIRIGDTEYRYGE